MGARKIEVDSCLEDLIPEFLENRQKDVSILSNLLSEQNFTEISAIAHKLKGNSGGYGFKELSEIGAEMEIAAGEQEGLKVKSLIESMDNYLKDLEIEYVEME